MVNLNRDQAEALDFPRFKEGVYYVEVKASEERIAQSSAAYFNVTLAAVEHGMQTICYDILMLAGKGHGIGLAKLDALGFEKRHTLEAGELVGRRVYAALVEEEYQGKKRLCVDIGAEGAKCGYWPEGDDGAPDTVKPGATQPQPPQPPQPPAVDWMEGDEPF